MPAAPSEDTGLDAAALLTTKGVDEPVALRLAKSHDAERITALIQRFDAENDAGANHSPGWLVAAIREGYAVHTPATHREKLLTFGQARDAYNRMTGGDPTRPFDRYFEPIKTARGTRFKKKRPAQYNPSHRQ